MLITILCIVKYLTQHPFNWTISNLHSIILPCLRRKQNYRTMDAENSVTTSINESSNPSQEPSSVPLKEMFDAAVKVIQSLPKDGPYQPSNSTKLRFYSLFKQSLEGKCTQPQPSIFSIVNRAKWDAWNRLGDMEKDKAMVLYIEELKKIVETMSFSGDVQDFLESINPFYEFVSLQGSEMAEIKESLERLTSSSSSQSSSGNSSARTTPFKAKLEENSWTHQKVPNALNLKESLEEPIKAKKANGHLTSLQWNQPPTSISFNPPPPPLHRRSVPNGIPYLNVNGLDSLNSESLSQQILKVDIEEIESEGQRHETLHARLSAETLTSGTESEPYFSGDSEPETESLLSPSDGSLTLTSAQAPGSSPQNIIFSGNSIDTIYESSRSFLIQGSQSCPQFNNNSNSSPPTGFSIPSNSSSPNPQPLDLILKTTVERLNRDVDHILARIRLLEAAYANNEQFGTSNTATVITNRRSIFGVSAQTLTIILTWPFIAYFIIQLVKLWFNRRRQS